MKNEKNNKNQVFAAFFILSLIWILLDQLTKNAMEEILGKIAETPALPGIFKFNLVHNYGAAWGIFGGATLPLILFSILVCIAIIIYLLKMWQHTNMFIIFGASLIFAGGIGNMIDRISLGYVIDFISLEFINFPVFNIADIGVTVGVILFMFGMIVEGVKA